MLDRDRWKIADDLFEAALDLPPEERVAFLHARCDDPEIRAKVESLLAKAAADTGFVKPGGAMEGPLGDALLHRSDAAAKEESIDGYRLLRRVGEGGMGEVWEAEQHGAIRRRVAVKLVKAGLANAQVIARFDSERQAIARMSQPNIARVYGGGSSESGRPYFAMEFVDGDRITDHCDRERFSIEMRLELFAQVCDGVQHAHHKGIIHRDIKPSNVLIATEDGKPVPKIIDFGVARVIERDASGETSVTEVGQVIGTPQYMSPEQTEVRPEEIDTRTDVYSLGVLLYELLVGVRPFELKEPSSSSLVELHRQIRETDPARPSKRVAALGQEAGSVARNRLTQASRLTRLLRGDLDWIVVRCLEKDPARRYATPQELAADVRRHLAGEPVSAGPPSLTYRGGKWIRRHRWVSAVAAVAILALIGGTVVSSLQARRAMRAESEALAEAETARQVATFLEELFEGADPGVALGRDPRASELMAAARERLNDELQDQPRIRARLLHTIGKIERKLGRLDDAAPLLEQALQLREATLGPLHTETVESVVELARLRDDRGDMAGAAEQFQDALSRVERSESPDPLQRAEVASRLANSLMMQGRLDEAEPLQQLALTIREDELGVEHVATANSMSILAHIQYRRSDFESADVGFRRVLAIRERLLGEGHPDVAMSQRHLASVLARRGGFDEEQEDLLHRSLATMQQVFGEEHAEVAGGLLSLATFHSRHGRLDEGERWMHRALAVSLKVHGPEHPRLASLYSNLGLTNKLQGDFEEAEQLLTSSLAILDKHSSPDDYRIPWTLNMLGSLALDLERYDEATARFERSLATIERVHGTDHAQSAGPLRGLAGIALDAGDLQRAERLFRRAVEIVEQAHGKSYPNLAPQLEGLGETLTLAGHNTEARDYLDQALALREETGGADFPGVIMPLCLLAALERQLGNLDEAERLDGRALTVAETALGADHLDVARALQGLTETELARGDRASARDHAERALTIRTARLPAGHSLVRQSAAALEQLQR